MSVVVQSPSKRTNLSVVTVDDAGPMFAERTSDCWPDWSTPLNPLDLAKAAARNRPSKVFAEVGKTVAVIAGLVLLVQVTLLLFHLG